MRHSLFLLTSSLVLAAGCGGSCPEPATAATASAPAAAEPVAASTPTSPPGTLDPELVALAVRVGNVERVAMRLGADGSVEKLAIYHGSAEDIPEVVRQLAEERFPGGAVVVYESERYADGARVHEVEVRTADGRECEVAGRDDGSLVYEECEMPAAELPAPVRAAVDRTVAGGEIVEAERKQGPGIDQYNVEVRVGEGPLQYLRLRPDGELLGHAIQVPATVELPVR